MAPGSCEPVVVHTDCSTRESGAHLRLGAVVFWRNERFVGSWDVPMRFVEKWLPRETYFNLGELAAAWDL